MHRVKAFASEIATQNSAPFMHRYLYREHIPPCMLSCFTTSVLYSNRSPANAANVIRALQQSVEELVGAVPKLVVTPTERLARTQALFLYQVIRLFDGDVSLRAQAESDMTLLETWLGDLCKVRENLEGLPRIGDIGTSHIPPKEWEVSSLPPSFSQSWQVIDFVVQRDGYLPSPYEEQSSWHIPSLQCME